MPSPQIVARLPTHDDEVGLRRREGVEGDWLLLAYPVPAAERSFDRGANEGEDDRVALPLRLAGDEEAVEQLDVVLRAEDAGIDDLVVARPCQAPQWERGSFHRHHGTAATAPVQWLCSTTVSGLQIAHRAGQRVELGAPRGGRRDRAAHGPGEADVDEALQALPQRRQADR